MTSLRAGSPVSEKRRLSEEISPASHVCLLVVDGGGFPNHLVELLQSFRYDVRVVSPGVDVLVQMDHMESLAGVILAVHRLMDGNMMLLATLRERYPQIPVMTIGRVEDLKLLRRSIELGAAEYVVTPTDQDLLKRKCAHVLSGRTGPSVRDARLQSPQASSHRTERKG
jgi:DNA-binding NtrC family response regulator